MARAGGHAAAGGRTVPPRSRRRVLAGTRTAGEVPAGRGEAGRGPTAQPIAAEYPPLHTRFPSASPRLVTARILTVQRKCSRALSNWGARVKMKTWGPLFKKMTESLERGQRAEREPSTGPQWLAGHGLEAGPGPKTPPEQRCGLRKAKACLSTLRPRLSLEDAASAHAGGHARLVLGYAGPTPASSPSTHGACSEGLRSGDKMQQCLRWDVLQVETLPAAGRVGKGGGGVHAAPYSLFGGTS